MAAKARFPNADVIAVDISGAVTKHLKRQRRNWRVYKQDFLTLDGRPHPLQRYQRRIDLVLLNPPFSCRGARRYGAKLGDETLWCSRAMAFLIGSLKYLSDRGEILAIMPNGSMTA